MTQPGFGCRIGFHTWTGCVCLKCGKHRDAEHQWRGCKCVRCDKVRNQDHVWDDDAPASAKCINCGVSRVEVETPLLLADISKISAINENDQQEINRNLELIYKYCSPALGQNVRELRKITGSIAASINNRGADRATIEREIAALRAIQAQLPSLQSSIMHGFSVERAEMIDRIRSTINILQGRAP